MNIRDIQKEDFPEVLALNHISVAVLSPLDEIKLKRLIHNASIAKVVIIDREVAAFILAFRDGAEYQSINYQWFNKHFKEFLYIDRIVVSEHFRGQKLASRIYDYTINWAKEKNVKYLLAEIDIFPPNQASLRFHQKYKFAEVEQLTHSENKVVSLQKKDLK